MPNRQSRSARAIDHCVLPTAGLGLARGRLEKLGFTVAADASHPFGTANCCVFFSDGTYLEPLALVDEAVAREAGRKGNAFTARDLAYRYRCGDDGFSALVFKTNDAKSDHDEFLQGGVSAGQMVEFSRDFADRSGKIDTASFRLAFAGDLRSPDAFFFTCERVRSPNVDRSQLLKHENGVTGIKSILFSALHAGDFADFLSIIIKAEAEIIAGKAPAFETGNVRVVIMDEAEYSAGFTTARLSDPGLRLRAIVFGVSDIAATEALLRERKTAYDRRGPTLAVGPAPGQGACFMFEEE